jgi:endonuclease/exonuclease/phosphatase family metal-dependent hydrolase
MVVRVVTLNLWGLNGWFEGRAAALEAGLRALAPDIVCFQEATIRSRDGEVYHPAAAIGEAVGLRVSAFSPYGNPAETMSPLQGGVAILSRWPIRVVENRRLPSGHAANDHRVALIATLAAPGGDLRVVTTHLSWRPEESEIRLVQAGVLLDYLSRCRWCGPAGRLILAGDLNATEDEPAIHLISERLKDAFRAAHPRDPGFTWVRQNPFARPIPPSVPDRRIDYLFCPRGARVASCRVVLDQPSPVYPSDHFGVFAELDFHEDPA